MYFQNKGPSFSEQQAVEQMGFGSNGTVCGLLGLQNNVLMKQWHGTIISVHAADPGTLKDVGNGLVGQWLSSIKLHPHVLLCIWNTDALCYDKLIIIYLHLWIRRKQEHERKSWKASVKKNRLLSISCFFFLFSSPRVNWKNILKITLMPTYKLVPLLTTLCQPKVEEEEMFRKMIWTDHSF